MPTPKRILTPKVANLTSREFYYKYIRGKSNKQTVLRYLRYYNKVRKQKTYVTKQGKLRRYTGFSKHYQRKLGLIVDHYTVWSDWHCKGSWGSGDATYRQEGEHVYHSMVTSHRNYPSKAEIQKRHKRIFPDHEVVGWSVEKDGVKSFYRKKVWR